MHPKVVRRSLKTIGEAVRMLFSRTPRWHLLHVLVATFLLHLVLTVLLVKIASPAVNLDSMALFYGIEDNSTTAATAVAMAQTATVDGKATETSPPWLWKLELLGELFWRLTLITTIFSFSKVLPLEDQGANPMVRQGRYTPPLNWREVKSLALVVSIGDIVVMCAFVLLEEIDLDYHLRKVTGVIDYVYLVAVVVISSEGLYDFDAIDRGWDLIAARYGDVSVFGVTFYLTQEALEYYARRMMAFFQRQQKQLAAAVIREDTAAEMLQFSLVAAFASVIMQSVVCSVILAFYKESTIREQRRSEAAVYEIKKIRRLAGEFASLHLTPETEVFKRELLRHTIALEHMVVRRPIAAAPGTSPSRERRAGVEMQMERTRLSTSRTRTPPPPGSPSTRCSGSSAASSKPSGRGGLRREHWEEQEKLVN